MKKAALKVEAAVIDLIGIRNLTNVQKGHKSSLYGRLSIDQLVQRYNHEVADITEEVLLIRINKEFFYGISDEELYNVTRHCWRLSERRNDVQYVMAIYNGIVQEVYCVAGWFQAGATIVGSKRTVSDRWEFVGTIAEDEIRRRYLNKSVEHYFGKGDQNPVKYLNC